MCTHDPVFSTCVRFHGIYWWGLSVMVRLNDSLFAITADLVNDMIKMSMYLALFFSFFFFSSCTSEREMN